VLVGRVVIGMDPHKRSATIEVLDEAEQQLTAGRFGTDSEGYRLLLAAGGQGRGWSAVRWWSGGGWRPG
jgi:transposase